jgi:DNA-binding MarR family transcriptional regulator
MEQPVDPLIQRFGHYMTDVAGVPVTLKPRPLGSLPPFLRQRYELQPIHVAGEDVTAIILREPDQFAPATFEKHLRELPLDVLHRYVLIATALPSYIRHRLVERGIPFVVPGTQMNWPQFGVVVRAREGRKPLPALDQISPATQATIVGTLAGMLPEDLTAKDAARRLGYTPMTMTRAFDELEGAGLADTARHGHQRHLHFAHHGKDLWEAACPRLRDPVRKTLRLRTADMGVDRLLLAGESALAAETMLAEPPAPVYAMGPVGWAELRARRLEEVPVEEDGTCLLQIWAYEPEIAGRDGRVDPFSLLLSMQHNEDERIAMAIEEMKGRMVS